MSEAARSITPDSDAPSAHASGNYVETAAFFDRFSSEDARWRRRNAGYHGAIERIYRSLIPAGHSVLELGSGAGDLLSALRPSRGVGVDVSPEMVELAQREHPELQFRVAAGESVDAGGVFDYVVLSDVVPYVHDLLELFENAAAHSHRRTRVVINSYNPTWRPVLGLAERLGLRPRKPIRNWVSPGDIRNLLELSGFDVVSSSTRILLPKRVPLLSTFLNAYVGSIWPLTKLGVSYWIVARPDPEPLGQLSVTVVCPCRNEAGHIPQIVERTPDMGAGTELIFVEGGSTDDTRAVIERQIELHPDRDISLLVQTGRGKGDAVRTGFAAAKNDVLMILDGDVSVQPEDLPKFYEALSSNRGEMINGSRLVYDMEHGSMRFLNMLGNKAFSLVFKAITGHHVKDTLCGTKVLHRDDYEAIVQNRSYFGDFDPFGDFDLLFGAARLNLKIVDLPVRYGARTYGTTNISRFRHGLLLLRDERIRVPQVPRQHFLPARLPRLVRRARRSDLASLAKEVGDDWKQSAYYDEAEASLETQWPGLIWPLIEDCDFTTVVELAPGHGRNSEKLRHLAKTLYLVDINQQNVDFLRQRFRDATNIVYIRNDGVSLEGIPDRTATLVYCFDAMVHFDSDVVRAYLREFNRVLRSGGRCFCHYSNYTGNPTGSYRDHPGGRNFMSKELFEHFASKEGLRPVVSQLVTWTEDEGGVDAMTVLKKR